MKRNLTIFQWLLATALGVHFLFVLLDQARDQGWKVFNNKFTNWISYQYMLPFWEQHWSMFSPNPPAGAQYFVFEYYSGYHHSPMVDIHSKVREGSFASFFSLDQRVIKYFLECYNDIILDGQQDASAKNLEATSHGFRSIKQYAKMTLQKQKDWMTDVHANDSVFVKMYLVNEPLPAFNNYDFKRDTTYFLIDKVYLGNKQTLL